jgi:site-specific recombinase XerD
MKFVDEKLFKTIRDFLEVYLPKQRRYSPNTKKSYRESLNLFLRFLQLECKVSLSGLSFAHINSQNVSGFMAWLKEKRNNSASTINGRLMAIKSFAKYCSIIDPSKAALQLDLSNISQQRTKISTVDFISEAGIECILKQPDLRKPTGGRNRVFMLLMYDTAARCQEMLDLKLGDVNVRDATITFHGKGPKLRRLPVSDAVLTELKQYILNAHKTSAQDDWLFYVDTGSTRRQMSPDAVALFFRNYGKQAHAVSKEVPEHIHPHLFRHSRAMHLYRNGLNLAILAEFMGHSHMDTTQIYAWSDTETKRKAMQKLPHIDNTAQAVWLNDDEMILKLYGLK